MLTYVPMSDFVPGNDQDNDTDLVEGWSRTDSAPLNAHSQHRTCAEKCMFKTIG